ncbi:MAG: hypothetical protein LUG62_01115 [Clostridiales bacterium]|nr:hypothetical protein [Clostridiales bacterium]
MTREDLAKMVGEDNADYAVDIILKNLQPGFIKSVLRSEKNDVEHQLKELEDDGFAYRANGECHVNWSKETYDDTSEAMEISRKLYSVNGLVYEKNRLACMMA